MSAEQDDHHGELDALDRSQLIDRIHQLEKHKSQAESEKRAFIESSYDGYWDWYPQHNYEYMSPRFWQIFGIDHTTKKHDPAEWQSLIFQEDLEVALRNFKLHCETRGQHPYRQEVRYRHADGSTVTVLCRGQVIEWDEQGNAVRMIGTHTDITPVRRAQELARESEKNSEFLANVSHELRSPLNSMLLLIDVLLENRDDNLNADQKEILEVIRSAGTDLRFLVNDFLDQRRIAKGKMPVQLQNIRVSAWIEEVMQQFEPVFAQKKIAFAVENHCSPQYQISSDKMRLNQIIRNLLSNAYKFTPENRSVSIEVIPLCETPMHLQLSVKDSGPGMDPDELQRIFHQFEQGKEGRKQRHHHHGTGLGLPIAKNIAQLLQASLTVASSSSNGTTFVLKIPSLHESDSVEAAHAAVAPATETGRAPRESRLHGEENDRVRQNLRVLEGKTILLVDDDVHTIFALRQMFLNQGINVLQAKDGEKAIAQFKECSTIDLVLMDIMMPNFDGFEAGEAIRKLPRGKETRIICMSGHVGGTDEQLQQSVFDGFIPKPIERTRLSEIIAGCFAE